MDDLRALRVTIIPVTTFSDGLGNRLTEGEFLARRKPDHYRMVYFVEAESGLRVVCYVMAYLLPGLG